MIYELRTLPREARPPSGDMVTAASTVSARHRKDDYGKLEGLWMTRDRALNQVCICGATQFR